MNGVTMILHRYSVTGVNAHGSDTASYSAEVIAGCVFAPGQEAEATQGSEQVTDQAQVFYPAALTPPPSPLDRWEYPPGVLREVIGDPSNWQSPFTGHTAYSRCRVQTVTGGTAHSVAKAAG